jgi:hypothetical protein
VSFLRTVLAPVCHTSNHHSACIGCLQTACNRVSDYVLTRRISESRQGLTLCCNP